MQTDIFRRPAVVIACILAISLLLTGALFAQHLAYEDESREAALAAERFHLLKQQDYELRFHTWKTIPGTSMTRRESLKHSALQLRKAESAWRNASAKQGQLRFMSAICTVSMICSYLSGLLLVVILALISVGRVLSVKHQRAERSEAYFQLS